MKVTASILLNVLVWNIRKFLLPIFDQNIIMESNILLNSILVYAKKIILKKYVHCKYISILVAQMKGKTVLCKRGVSFKPDKIIVTYKLLIPYLNFWLVNCSSHHIDYGFLCNMQVN